MNKARKSHIPDAVLLEFTGKEIDFLPMDLDRFSLFDPDLNQQKMSLLTDNYKKALTFGTDKTQLGVLRNLTENLSDEFKKCVSLYKDVRYFARKKFGSSPAILKQFGFETYRKARMNIPEMIVFMYELANTAEKYKNELATAGLSESVIDSIKPAAAALEKSNLEQETGKTARNVKTEERIDLINSIYDTLMEFSVAAKIIFANEPLTRDKYKIPYSKNVNGNAAKTQQP
jgi:hypothetical protein